MGIIFFPIVNKFKYYNDLIIDLNAGYFCSLSFANIPSYNYSLYWAGYSSSAFDGALNHSFMPVWEGYSFTVQAKRVNEPNAPIRSNPPGVPARFDGHLRNVSITFRLNDKSAKRIVFGTILTSYIYRGGVESLISSHFPLYTRKPGSFWSREFNEDELHRKKRSNIPINLADEPDNSYINLTFPVGVASYPNGHFGNGVMSVVLYNSDKRNEKNTDFGSSHQNFILLLLRT